MGFEIKNEEHQYNVDLTADTIIAIYIDGNKKIEYTVNPNYKASVTFMYQETPI